MALAWSSARDYGHENEIIFIKLLNNGAILVPMDGSQRHVFTLIEVSCSLRMSFRSNSIGAYENINQDGSISLFERTISWTTCY
jgi:hypothetical protein